MKAGWPLAWAAVLGAAGACVGWQLYASSAGPTAQSVALGMGAGAALFGIVAGVLTGRAIAKALARGQRRPAAALAGITLGAAGWLCWQARSSRLEYERLDAIRHETLTPERAKALLSGSREEVRALAYNRTCPPDVLAELAKNKDWAVRAGAAVNPGTPKASLDALSRDPDESVRLYLRYNPALKKRD